MNHIPSVREALLEMIALQKQRISQLEVENRYKQAELFKYAAGVSYSAFDLEHGEDLVIYGESWTLLSRDRNNESITIKRVRPT